MAGGAEILDQKRFFLISENAIIWRSRKCFLKNKVMIDKQEVGGNVNRTVRIEIATGEIFVKTSGSKEVRI